MSEIRVKEVITGEKIHIGAITNAVIEKGFSPYIQDGYWYEYDNITKTFINTGVKAQGEQGEAGKDGADGKDGEDYVLTTSDKEEIAQIVLNELPEAEEVEV